MDDDTANVIPDVRRVVAVCAHPDDESFGLGAIISTLTGHGVEVDLVCVTHGEASTLGADTADLGTARATELAAAARELGITRVELLDHPDGGLDAIPLADLVTSIRTHAIGSDLLLVFDDGGITGHDDHQRVTDAARCVADELDLPVLAWTLPQGVADVLREEFGTPFVGRQPGEIDITLAVDRHQQRKAVACHGSQLDANPVPARRLALTGDVESLRYLRR